VINLARDGAIPEGAAALMKEIGADYRLVLPFDTELAIAGETGRSMKTLSASNPIMAAISGFIEQLSFAGEKVHG
jgi:hypothetical protein